MGRRTSHASTLHSKEVAGLVTFRLLNFRESIRTVLPNSYPGFTKSLFTEVVSQ